MRVPIKPIFTSISLISFKICSDEIPEPGCPLDSFNCLMESSRECNRAASLEYRSRTLRWSSVSSASIDTPSTSPLLQGERDEMRREELQGELAHIHSHKSNSRSTSCSYQVVVPRVDTIGLIQCLNWKTPSIKADLFLFLLRASFAMRWRTEQNRRWEEKSRRDEVVQNTWVFTVKRRQGLLEIWLVLNLVGKSST